jgi:AraC-like DNA-binding protein
MDPGLPSGLLDAPLRSILLVETLQRTKAEAFRSVSPPGHLLHLVLSGKVEQYTDDRRQLLRPGSLVWYHQMESVEGRVLQAPWRFLSLNFIAPALPPPPDARRVRPARPAEIRQLHALNRLWHTRAAAPAARAFECFALLNQFLAGLAPRAEKAPGRDTPADLPTERWWAIEKTLRLDLTELPSLPHLARQAGLSLRSLARACLAATGLPPAKRIAALRIAQARHLLQVTDLPITEIALRVGYPRVQELSRAMRLHSNQTPREVRATEADYRQP